MVQFPDYLELYIVLIYWAKVLEVDPSELLEASNWRNCLSPGSQKVSVVVRVCFSKQLMCYSVHSPCVLSVLCLSSFQHWFSLKDLLVQLCISVPLIPVSSLLKVCHNADVTIKVSSLSVWVNFTNTVTSINGEVIWLKCDFLGFAWIWDKSVGDEEGCGLLGINVLAQSLFPPITAHGWALKYSSYIHIPCLFQWTQKQEEEHFSRNQTALRTVSSHGHR